MYQSRYANQITVTNTVPQRSPVSAMTGTEAAMVGGRFSFTHWIASSNYKSVRGHTFACIRPGLGGTSSRRAAQHESLSEANTKHPRPGPDCVPGFGVPYCGGGRPNPY